MDCPLCREPGGRLLWRSEALRVIEVDDPDYPGYTRVVLQDHLAEMTDLDDALRAQVMRTVWTIESAQRAVLAPDKVNLASLGNMVPHLHWHVIPRWKDDRHFPDAVWAPPRRPAGQDTPAVARARRMLPDYHARLAHALDDAQEIGRAHV